MHIQYTIEMIFTAMFFYSVFAKLTSDLRFLSENNENNDFFAIET